MTSFRRTRKPEGADHTLRSGDGAGLDRVSPLTPFALLALLGLLVALVAMPTPASAGECVREVTEQVRNPDTGGYELEITCVEWADEPGDGGSDGGDTEPVDEEPPLGGVYSVGVTRDEDDELCWRVRWNDLPGYEPNEDAWTWQEAYEVGEEMWGDDYPACPGADEPDPTGAVRRAWASLELLPEHEPHIAPGWALTGMPAYLEIGGPRTHETSVDLPAPFTGAAGISASASYTVDWGDGTVEDGIASTGGPYPDGDVVHTYADTDELEVQVTATWTGTWELGPASGPLPAIQLTRSVPLEVRELQAVRTTAR
jgi:hypothetical protein